MLVAQSCQIYDLPGSMSMGILVRIVEWVAFSSLGILAKGSNPHLLYPSLAGRFFTITPHGSHPVYGNIIFTCLIFLFSQGHILSFCYLFQVK